jgi:hypothetical protein
MTPDAPAVVAPAVDVHVGLRVGAFADPRAPRAVGLDVAYVQPRLSGAALPWLSWIASFEAGMPTGQGPPPNAPRVLDLVAKLEAAPSLNLWVGRFPVPIDRATLSGPFFMPSWIFPGVYPAGFVGPKTGPTGRDNGATIWGVFAGGRVKYHVGAFDLAPADADAAERGAMFVGRLHVCAIGEEPGYGANGSYLGERDVVALGLAVQTQAGGSGTPEDRGRMLTAVADLLAEGTFADVGTFTLEAAAYQFDHRRLVDRAFFVVAGFLSASPLGPGRLQPFVRWQQTAEPRWTIADAFVGYVVRGHDVRITAGVQHVDAAPIARTAAHVGLQVRQ